MGLDASPGNSKVFNRPSISVFAFSVSCPARNSIMIWDILSLEVEDIVFMLSKEEIAFSRGLVTLSNTSSGDAG
ncbi:hypothetical protein D3C75_944580 [compost metagenome]